MLDPCHKEEDLFMASSREVNVNAKLKDETNHAIAEILLSAAHKNFSWNQTTKSVNKVSLYCSVQYLVHLMRTDSMKIY